MKFKLILVYLKGVALFWLVGLFLIFTTEKLLLHKKINGLHTVFLDVIAPIATNVGDGLFALLIGVVFLFIEIRAAVLILLSFLVSSVFTQFLKQVVFSNSFRPIHYFENDPGFHFIEGVNYHHQFSFPSGHSTTCFALFITLALFFHSKKSLQVIFVILSILFAFTRVYLSQHFFEDILAGSVVGTVSGLLIWNLFFDKLSKFNKSIITLNKN